MGSVTVATIGGLGHQGVSVVSSSPEYSFWGEEQIRSGLGVSF